MTCRHFIAIALVALTATMAAPTAPNAAPGSKSVTDLPEFSGKALIVWAKEPVKGGVLQNPRVRRLGDKAFLVGESAKQDEADPDPDCVLWIPVEDVQLIHEYKTLEDARKAYGNHYKKDK